MQAEELFIGQAVRHVRGELEGTVVQLIEQPEPFPLTVDVRRRDTGRVEGVPINQLAAVDPEGDRKRPIERKCVKWSASVSEVADGDALVPVDQDLDSRI